MNKNKKPDFVIQWKDKSIESELEIHCEPKIVESTTALKAKLNNGFVLLEAGSTLVAVNEIPVTEPTAISFTPNRVGFSLLVASTSTVQYGYDSEDIRPPSTSGLLLMLPNRNIQATMSPGTMRTVTCTFDIDYAESIVGPLDTISQAHLVDALDIKSSLVNAIMFRLMNEAIYPGPISDRVVASLGQALLVECAHWLAVDKQPAKAPNQLSAQDFERIEQYLSNMEGKAPSVAELASACGLSERYFSKLFRQQTGCTLSQYIKSVKIAKAKNYLMESNLSLKEIAFQLGYSTPASFSYSFRAATGSTPAAFRNSNQ